MPVLTDQQRRFQQFARSVAEEKIASLADEMERTDQPSAALRELYRETGWLSTAAPAAF
ncbi:MAG: acyl-CoA dehydrogenase family protein [Mycobacteriales bacterium]